MKNIWKQELLLLASSFIFIALCYVAFTHHADIAWKHFAQKDIPFEMDYSNKIQPKVEWENIYGKQFAFVVLGTREGEGAFISLSPAYRTLPEIIKGFDKDSVFIKKISLSGYDAAIFKQAYYPREPHPNAETIMLVAHDFEYRISIDSPFTQHILDSFKIVEK